MEILDLKGNKQLVAFSEQSIEKSASRIEQYSHQVGNAIDFELLSTKVDKELLTGLGEMIDFRAELDISVQSTNIDLDVLNDAVHKRISKWSEDLKQILVVTFLSKILENMKYAPPNMKEDLLKDLYCNGNRVDISWIYFYAFREKLKEQELVI